VDENTLQLLVELLKKMGVNTKQACIPELAELCGVPEQEGVLCPRGHELKLERISMREALLKKQG